MAFKLKSGNKTSFKKMGATEAIKQVDTSSMRDDPTGQVMSRDPHYLDSPAKQAIGGGAGEALTHWEKFKKKAKKVVKKGTKAIKTGVKRNPYVTIASMLMAKSASADQPGTGKHGGTKTKTYDPKTGTYK